MDDVLKKARNPWNVPKLEKILGQLRELAKRQAAAGNAPVPDQTVADDGPVAEDRMALIAAEEAVVRPVLAVFGIDYDALVAMDGVSAYSQAVGANPALLDEVLMAPSPVLAALQVAVGYKPYADFAAAYGSEPATIKEKLKQELMAESAAVPVKTARGAVFSAPVGVRGERMAKDGLAVVFNK